MNDVTASNPPDATTSAPIDWKEVGRRAFHAGEMAAPALNRQVMDAIAGMPVGGGAADIMRAFSAGWDEANMAAPVDLEEPGVGAERYSVRHYDRNGQVERWFPTRDARTLYILTELRGAADVIGWQDPPEDYNGGNVYGPGKPV
jgi:hypothetical protein